MARIDRRRLHPRDCPRLERFGAAGDGGYVLPADVVDRCAVVLSLGLGTNWSFDTAVLARNPRLRLIGVDHSVGAAKFARQARRSGIKRVLYRLLGRREKSRKHDERYRAGRLWFELFRAPNEHVGRRVGPRPGPGVVTLEELMAKVADVPDQGVLLKMDIEGGEYDVVDAVVRHAAKVACFVVEFHSLGGRAEAFDAAIAALSGPFHVVHVHGNNCRPYDASIDFPDTIEVTFVNRALLPPDPPPSVAAYPRPGIDAPNRPDRPDYPLRFDG